MEAAIIIANDSSKNIYERNLANLVAIFFNKKIQAGIGFKKSKHKV